MFESDLCRNSPLLYTVIQSFGESVSSFNMKVIQFLQTPQNTSPNYFMLVVEIYFIHNSENKTIKQDLVLMAFCYIYSDIFAI